MTHRLRDINIIRQKIKVYKNSYGRLMNILKYLTSNRGKI